MIILYAIQNNKGEFLDQKRYRVSNNYYRSYKKFGNTTRMYKSIKSAKEAFKIAWWFESEDIKNDCEQAFAKYNKICFNTDNPSPKELDEAINNFHNEKQKLHEKLGLKIVKLTIETEGI